MKKIIMSTVMALMLSSTAVIADVKVGLGFGIEGTGYSSTSIRVPIDFDFGLRIEPDISMRSYTEEQDDGPTSGIEERTNTDIGLGIGAYYTLWARDKVNFYTGGRLGYSSNKSELTYSIDSNMNREFGSNEVNLQGVFGVEYYFIEEMSVAAQVGLEVYSEKGTDDAADRKEQGTNTISTLVLRYFF